MCDTCIYWFSSFYTHYTASFFQYTQSIKLTGSGHLPDGFHYLMYCCFVGFSLEEMRHCVPGCPGCEAVGPLP